MLDLQFEVGTWSSTLFPDFVQLSFGDVLVAVRLWESVCFIMVWLVYFLAEC